MSPQLYRPISAAIKSRQSSATRVIRSGTAFSLGHWQLATAVVLKETAGVVLSSRPLI